MNNAIFRSIMPAAFLAAILTCLSSVVSTNAATTTVNVGQGGFVFVPANPTINLNDTINFVWIGANHTSTSQPSSAFQWSSGPTAHNPPFTLPVTFTQAGSFPYECTVHFSFNMTGVVTVVSAAVPPTITITNPLSGTVLSAPANATIAASTTDTSGTVTNVQFLVASGGSPTPFANVTTPPFTATINNLAAGSYTLTAIATDTLAASGTNSISLSVATPVTNILSQAHFLSATNLTFSYSANVGLKYVIQRSSDLRSANNWISLVTNQAAANPATFTDTNAIATPAFYRVGLMPNP